MRTQDMQATLEQDDWLRRMARRLFHDPSIAEDAAQDAWMAQLARQAPVADSTPWLGGVLRNLRREQLRNEARRGAHASELQSRGARMAPATDEVVADLQLRQEATRALLALDEPIRTTLYLRFVQDLPVTEVATRMNVAQSTASDRITKGLESLRKTLDERHGGDRRAWLTVLAPLAFESKKPVATGVLTAKVAGWMAAACVAAALGTTLVLRSAASEPSSSSAAPVLGLTPTSSVGAATPSAAITEPMTPPPARSRADRELASAAGLGAGSDTGSDATSTLQEAPPKARIRAQVLLPDGKPATGAQWQLIAVGGKAQLGDWENQTGTVDAEGKVDVTFTPPSRTLIALTFSLDGYVRTGEQWNELEPDTDKTLDPMRFFRAGGLRGRLVDEKGDPILEKSCALRLMAPGRINGIPLSMGKNQAVDPENGRFEMKGLSPGKAQIHYLVKEAGWVIGPLVEVVAGEMTDVDIVWSEKEVAAAVERAKNRIDLSQLPQFESRRQGKIKREPREKLEPVRLTLDLGDAVGPEDGVQAAFMGAMDLNAKVLSGKGAVLGPARVDPGAADTLWIRGKGWLARVDKPALQVGGEQTLKVELELIERRVRVLRAGEPVRNREFAMQVLPSQFHMRPGAGFWKTDEEGRATLRLGRLPKGEGYRFRLQARTNEDGSLTYGTAEWSGSTGDLTVELK